MINIALLTKFVDVTLLITYYATNQFVDAAMLITFINATLLTKLGSATRLTIFGNSEVLATLLNKSLFLGVHSYLLPTQSKQANMFSLGFFCVCVCVCVCVSQFF